MLRPHTRLPASNFLVLACFAVFLIESCGGELTTVQLMSGEKRARGTHTAWPEASDGSSDRILELEATSGKRGRYNCHLDIDVCSSAEDPVLLYGWAYELTRQGLETITGIDQWKSFGEALPGQADTLLEGECSNVFAHVRYSDWTWACGYHPETFDWGPFRLDNPTSALKWNYDVHDTSGTIQDQLSFYSVEWDVGEPWPSVNAEADSIEGHAIALELSTVFPQQGIQLDNNDVYTLTTTIRRLGDRTRSLTDTAKWCLVLKSAGIKLLSTDSTIYVDVPAPTRAGNEDEYVMTDIPVPYHEDQVELSFEVALRDQASGKEAPSKVLKRPLLLVSPRYFSAFADGCDVKTEGKNR